MCELGSSLLFVEPDEDRSKQAVLYIQETLSTHFRDDGDSFDVSSEIEQLARVAAARCTGPRNQEGGEGEAGQWDAEELPRGAEP